MQAQVSKPPAWNQFDRVVRPIGQQLKTANIGMSTENLRSTAVLGGLGSAVAGLVVADLFKLGIIGAIASGLGLCSLFVAGFVIVVRQMAARRLRKFNDQFENVLRLLVSSLRAGLGFRQGLVTVTQSTPEPANVEFSVVLSRISIGVSVEDALQELSERMPSMEMTMFSQAVRIQSKTGGNLGKTLLNLAEMIKQRRRIARRIAALTAESQSSKWIVSGIPVVIALFIIVTQADMREALFTTMIGHITLALTAAGIVVGWIVFEKMGVIDV